MPLLLAFNKVGFSHDEPRMVQPVKREFQLCQKWVKIHLKISNVNSNAFLDDQEIENAKYFRRY